VNGILHSTAKCGSEAGTHHCRSDLNGKCLYIHDGFYLVNSSLLALGLVLFVTYIRPKIEQIQRIPPMQWRLAAAQARKDTKGD